jgi:hypothetical protein
MDFASNALIVPILIFVRTAIHCEVSSFIVFILFFMCLNRFLEADVGNGNRLGDVVFLMEDYVY